MVTVASSLLRTQGNMILSETSGTARNECHGAGSALEVLATLIKLGVTSLGGPVAHLGYFRAEIVERRRWLDEQAYADLVA